jgi:exodeoxyribonuclease VII large subunit
MNRATEHIYTPSELNREVRLHLEAGFPRILLEAEISNLSRPASGHLYFSLKDEKAQIRCAFFRSSAARAAFRPENGMRVLARGRIGLYEPRGEYQMIIDSLQDAGEGLLQRRFEELKNRLEKEGLFDTARKRPLPVYPGRIAVITSPGGAAVRDILHVFARRWPAASIRIYPASVQGSEAPAEILRALQAANRHGWAELLIVARGGGSLEDLMAFNDEAVARAIHASSLPVISAVGHETDFSISDFVADLRAPTPSAAAELVTPDRVALAASIRRLERQLHQRMSDRLQREGQRLDHALHRLQQRHPVNRLAEQARQLQATRSSLKRSMGATLERCSLRLENLMRRLALRHPARDIAERSARVDAAAHSMRRALLRNLVERRMQLKDLARTLNAVSPLATLGRGYAVLLSGTGDSVISRAAAVAAGEEITAQLADGRLHCTVNASNGFTLDTIEKKSSEPEV